jgi:hypothetical protein
MQLMNLFVARNRPIPYKSTLTLTVFYKGHQERSSPGRFLGLNAVSSNKGRREALRINEKLIKLYGVPADIQTHRKKVRKKRKIEERIRG